MGNLSPSVIEEEVLNEGKYTKLTTKGKAFIREKCNVVGNSLLSGKNTYSLPLFQPGETVQDKTWTANPIVLSVPITTNKQLGEALIQLYDYYGNEFKMDANFLAAQAYIESGFKIWDYAETSTGSGLVMIKIEELFNYGLVNDNDEINDYSPISLTTDEINKLRKNIIDPNTFNSYSINSDVGRKNREQLHQNVIDNLSIIVKLHYRYMKYLANRYNPLASCTLFGYDRGEDYLKNTYTDSINAAKNKENDYEKDGVNYVFNVFNTLYESFGYTELNMSQTESEFDSFAASVSESDKYNFIDYPSPDFNITEYLTYYQAISYASAHKTPERRAHKNIPNEVQMQNLLKIGRTIYDVIRHHFDYNIPITTGYRGANFLNKDVGGSSTSQHKEGEALDLQISQTSLKHADIFYYIANNLEYGQLIWERGSNATPRWIHVSLKTTKFQNQLLIYVPETRNLDVKYKGAPYYIQWGTRKYFTVTRRSGESVAAHVKRFNDMKDLIYP